MLGNLLLEMSSFSWSHFQLQNIKKTIPTNTKKNGENSLTTTLMVAPLQGVNYCFFNKNEYVELECTRMKELGYATKKLRKVEHATKSM
jgi:hypothetical protein